MPNCWLCVTSEENWDVVKKRKIWGVSERNKGKIERVKPGDFLVFYVKPKKITGIFKATTKSFEDKNRIFNATGFSKENAFPYRVKLDIVKLARRPVGIEQLIGKFDFVVSKRMWSAYFRRAMRVVPEADFRKIMSSIEQS